MKRKATPIKASGNGAPTRRASDTRVRQPGPPDRALALDGTPGPSAAALMDVEFEELLEFLEADLCRVDADPAFEERLRLELWWMILSGVEPGDRTPES